MFFRTCPIIHIISVVALVFGSIAAAPPVAPEAAPDAADALKLAIAPIEITGGGDDPLLASQLDQDLRGGLARGNLQLIGADDVARVAGGACSDDPCLTRLRDQLGAAFVLRATVTVSDRDYTLRLELIATRDLNRAAESERGCELCGLAELRALTADQAARLLARLDALAKPPPTFEIATAPAGALVFIDDQLVGVAPVERTVLEGKHVIRVMSEGFVPEERELVALAGLRESLQIDLRRTPEALKLRGAGWGLLAAGIPVALLGVGLLALDDQLYRGRCEGPDVDAAGQCRFIFDTAWGGAGALAVGTLLGTAGVMLLRRTRDRAKASKPRVQTQLGPTYLGLRGAF